MDPKQIFGIDMPVNLSIKNVPDALAQVLRDRAAANRRSLQQELMCLLEQAVGRPPGHDAAQGVSPRTKPGCSSTIDHGFDTAAHTDGHLPSNRPRKSLQEVAEKARRLFPQGTEDSTPLLRQMRDAGLRGKA